MAPLVETNDVVEALDLYDGDVIKHPTTGAVMTVTAHMHLDPHHLDLIPGVVRFDVYDGLDVDGPLEWEGPEEQLIIGPGMRIRRLPVRAPTGRPRRVNAARQTRSSP